MQPARELAQLGVGQRDLLARLREQVGRAVGVGRERAPCQVEQLPDRHQLLLGAVVQVARDPRALGVRRLDGGLARGHELVLALAQRGDLVEQVSIAVLGERGHDETELATTTSHTMNAPYRIRSTSPKTRRSCFTARVTSVAIAEATTTEAIVWP